MTSIYSDLTRKAWNDIGVELELEINKSHVQQDIMFSCLVTQINNWLWSGLLWICSRWIKTRFIWFRDGHLSTFQSMCLYFMYSVLDLITFLSTGGQAAARHEVARFTEVKPLHTLCRLLIAEQIAALKPDTVLTAWKGLRGFSWINNGDSVRLVFN